jgi:hypothetical protein
LLFFTEFEEEIVESCRLPVVGFPSFGGVPEGWGGLAPIASPVRFARVKRHPFVLGLLRQFAPLLPEQKIEWIALPVRLSASGAGNSF